MKIAIFTRHKAKYSETFISASIRHLNKVEVVFYEGNFPKFYGNDQLVNPTAGLINKVKHSAEKKLFKNTHNDIRSDALSRILIKHKIDVALAHYAESGASVIDGCEKAGVPLVVHCHGSDAHKKRTVDFWRNRYQYLSPRVAQMIAVSDKMKQALIEIGFAEDRITLRPYGVDFETFAKIHPGSNPPHFLSVGRFTDKKAPYLTVLAFQKVLETCSDARLTMAGDGELLETTRNLVNALGLGNAVTFPGILSHDEVAQEMQKARAFVQHSIEPSHGDMAGDSEGSPVAILEASACGLPIVATRHAGINESVIHGKTGYLVQEHDVNGMAVYMSKIANDASLANSLGLEAIEHMRKNYSMDQYITALSSVLKNACS